MFVDYYEVLEVSSNANADTIDRIFRHLAMRYHPDNRDTGDASRFSELMEAYNTVKDPARRAQYDIQHKENSGLRVKLAEGANDANGVEWDVLMQDRILSMLYVKRRQDMSDPGIGAAEIERLSDCPREHMEFHLWYLKAKGWIRREENGTLAITVEGVDRCNTKERSEARSKQLTHEPGSQ